MKTKFMGLVITLVFVVGGPLAGLTVTLDDNYPPFSFRDVQGRLQGISVDQWQLWSRKTGVPVDLVGQTWSGALQAMRDGRADVLDTVFLTPERQTTWAFTPIYAVISTAVYHRDGLSGLRQPADLQGFLVGVKSGDASADALRAQGVVSFREYPDYASLVAAAGRGEVLVFCMDVPAARHFLLAQHLESQFRQAFVLSEDGFRRAVAKDRHDLLALVDRGFAQLSQAEKDEIDRKWRGGTLLEGMGASQVALLILAGLAVLGLLVGFIFWLRYQIARRTGELVGTEAALKLSEDKARALVEALPDLLFLIDAQGVVQEALGPPRSDLYGDPGGHIGKPVAAAFGPEVVAEARQKMEGLVPGQLATLEASLEVAGERRTYEGRIVKLTSPGYLALVRDVSASRRAWHDDLHRNKLESLALLAGGLAHDFNNSLAVIQGFVSLARIQLGQPEKALGSLDKAVQAARRAAGLTSQLRVLAQSGEVNRTLLSVKDLAEESASFALVGSPCVLAVEADEGPWSVEADPDQLSQVFHNLALNAVQAMPQGGTVTLVFRRVGPRVLVSVVDEGGGIPEEHRPRLFDPYFTTKPKGTGLGLSVVHAVVQRHGGGIEVDSRPGQGSVFTVSLPAAEGRPPPDASVRVEPATFEGRRVLIMEDEADLRTLMGEVCQGLGLRVTACRNGREALAAFDEASASGTSFELLISDILVPGDMGGAELIAALRTRDVPFRALAVTGFSVDRVGDLGSQGFDVVVGKPFTIEELKSRIVELMKSPWKTDPNPASKS